MDRDILRDTEGQVSAAAVTRKTAWATWDATRNTTLDTTWVEIWADYDAISAATWVADAATWGAISAATIRIGINMRHADVIRDATHA